MKKGFYLDEKHRDEVVSSMAKKLADRDETMVFKKRSDPVPLFFVIIGICLVAVIAVVALVSFGEKEVEQPVAAVESAAPASPVELIETAYERGEITINDYGVYLTNVLVRYDSVPEAYRVERPMIIPDDIFIRLLRVWKRIRPELRVTILKDIPQLEQMVEDMESNRE